MNITLIGFLKKELSQALRDVRMRGVIFIMPMIQMIIFGLAISTEMKNVRLKAVYAPGDRVARRVEERALASKWFVPAKTEGNDQFHWIRSGQANAVLMVPSEGLTKTFERGEGQIQILVDAINAVRARGIERYFQAVIEEVALAENPAATKPPPVSLDVRVLYNPSMETAFFMVPGVMGMLLTVLTVILTSISMSKEKEIGTFEMLISAPVKNWEILLGKTLPFVFLGMVVFPLVLSVAVFGFGVPIRGHLWQLFLVAFIYVCTAVSIGTLISTFAGNQQQAMMGGFLFLFPSLLLSGLMYPVENMPGALIWIAYLNPLRYFVTLLRNIMLKGGDYFVVWTNLGALVILGAACIWLSFKRFKQTLN